MTDPTPDTVAALLDNLYSATEQDRDEELAGFLVRAWPSLQAQNN